MTIQGLSRSTAETRLWGSALGGMLKGHELVLLHGGLGVGKTRFVQGLFAGMNGDPDEIVSPTFTLMNVHGLPGGGRILHYDLYRLESMSRGRMPEIDDELGEALQVVEWAQYLDPRYRELPETVSVTIDFADSDDRAIRIQSTRLDGPGLERELRSRGIILTEA